MNATWSAPGPAIGPGRRWGSHADRYDHDGRYDARLNLKLPVALAEQLHRACY